jgi:phosphonate transport system substrate-binding protein
MSHARPRIRCLALAGISVLLSAAAQAQEWKAKYPELVMAAAPVENSAGVTDRYTPFIGYLARELDVKVTLRIVNDYAAVIEGQRAGNIHVAHYGPSSYARAWSVTKGGVEVFATFVSADSSEGLYPALFVRADSPAQSIVDLKAKNLCLVDPNSTTGNDGPRFSMSKMGIDADRFFAKVVYAGSHENAIIAARQGTCDAAFSWWASERDSMILRMAKKSMVKSDEFRLIYKADIIPTAPFAYLANMPTALKETIRKAFIEAYGKDRVAVERLWDGQYLGFKAASHNDYEGSVELQRFVDQLRRQRS